MATGRVRVYIATSLDGFIAGPGDDLSWLPGSDEMSAGLEDATRGGELTYEAFMADVGALLMGRRTYDVVRGFDVPWPFEDHPVLVATWRPLDPGAPATVRAVAGDIRDMVSLALEAAGGRDVYLDGGRLIRQAAEADLIEDLTVTVAPVALGEGLPLFAGLSRRYPLEILSHHSSPGGMVQLRMRPCREVGEG
jgi:dihydrofolate reductase